jgi:large subunit GTPase 1
LDVNDLDDFLIQAEMANREFISEKEQVVVLDSTAQAAGALDMIDEQQNGTASNASASHFAFQELSVPRRPAWDETTTPEELDKREKESFLEWRRAIAKREEEIILNSPSTSVLGVTPFEKNIEIWRQLWRVMERSSCIVQIVDARNPLFYLSKDLKHYATQELGKPMLLLINKSDYLSPLQRKAWHDYFSDPEHLWEHVFFSAHQEQQRLDAAASQEEQGDDVDPAGNPVDDDDSSDEEEGGDKKVNVQQTNEGLKSISLQPSSTNVGVETPLSRAELLDWLREFAKTNDCAMDSKYERIPYSMVGFPNVGKSSVINVLMGNARNTHGVVRVGVASQPGKTKHFQTLLLPDRSDMLLCDCPGLVFPSFVNNTADLIAAGVYPIAQMRDWRPVVELLCRRIPREILNAQYGIRIPMPTADAMMEAALQGNDGKIPSPTAEEFLTTFCLARSMLAASSGAPDYQRAARLIIKEYADGKLLYCHSPPNFEESFFQKETFLMSLQKTKKLRDKLLHSGEKSVDIRSDDIDGDGSVAEDDPTDEDALLFEMMGGFASVADPYTQKQPTRKKKWGKKGKKFRNKDPYGMFATPDDILGEDGNEGEAIVGVTVMGGKKHRKKGYTRQSGYGSVRAMS